MNAWTIYWILQLDSINGLLWALLALVGMAEVIALVVWLHGAAANPDSWYSETFKEDARAAQQRAPQAKSYFVRMLLTAFIPLCLLTALIPSTKTAAAMVIVPAIANNETIRKESGELYGLAKQALRDAVTDKAEDAAKEAAK